MKFTSFEGLYGGEDYSEQAEKARISDTKNPVLIRDVVLLLIFDRALPLQKVLLFEIGVTSLRTTEHSRKRG